MQVGFLLFTSFQFLLPPLTSVSSMGGWDTGTLCHSPVQSCPHLTSTCPAQPDSLSLIAALNVML